MTTQTDMGNGFGRLVDDEVESVATEWLDIQAQIDELTEKKNAAGDRVLARMQARGLRVYECADETTRSCGSPSRMEH